MKLEVSKGYNTAHHMYFNIISNIHQYNRFHFTKWRYTSDICPKSYPAFLLLTLTSRKHSPLSQKPQRHPKNRVVKYTHTLQTSVSDTLTKVRKCNIPLHRPCCSIQNSCKINTRNIVRSLFGFRTMKSNKLKY